VDIRLDGLRALVTGANSGIGAAIARELAGAGARVAINYVVHPEATTALVAELSAAGGTAVGLMADVGDVQQVEAMYAQLDQQWGGLDILVNNAGIDGTKAPTWESDPVAWQRVLHVNLFGSFLCARGPSARTESCRTD